MDFRIWKKALAVGLVSAAAFSNSTAYAAAQATVTVDVNMPTILVMYHYSTITLDLDQAALATYLVGGTPVCGTEFCDDQGNPAAIPVPAITANTSVTQAVSDPGLSNTTTEFTIVDPVGVRGMGCSTYDVVVTDSSSDAGITVDTANSLSAIDGTACSFALTTGDLVFDVNFALIDVDPASAVFDVSITGI
jgi:hypothetical protein